MTIQIDGLNKKQRVLADIMWAMDSVDAVAAFIDSLTIEDQREARNVMNLMIWAMLDTVTDTNLAESALEKYRL